MTCQDNPMLYIHTALCCSNPLPHRHPLQFFNPYCLHVPVPVPIPRTPLLHLSLPPPPTFCSNWISALHEMKLSSRIATHTWSTWSTYCQLFLIWSTWGGQSKAAKTGGGAELRGWRQLRVHVFAPVITRHSCIHRLLYSTLLYSPTGGCSRRVAVGNCR